MSWLAISWVFGRQEEFNAVTRVIERASEENLVAILNGLSPSLPIPSSIIGRSHPAMFIGLS